MNRIPGQNHERPGLTPSTPSTGAPGPSISALPPSSGGRASVAQQPARPKRSAGRTLSQTLTALLLVFVTAMLVLFVVFNTQVVQVSLVFSDVQAPLVVALLIAAVLGGLVAALCNAVMRVRRGRRNR